MDEQNGQPTKTKTEEHEDIKTNIATPGGGERPWWWNLNDLDVSPQGVPMKPGT